MATYRAAVMKANGETTHYTLKRATQMGAIREVETMRAPEWVVVRLEIYSLSKSAWEYIGKEWRLTPLA